MIQLTVSEQFKENILKFGKLISVRITFSDGTVYEKDDITYCSKAFEGEPFKSIMQYVDIELKNSINVRNKTFDLEFGVKVEETDSYEYISWGKYSVDNESIEKKIDTKTTKFTAYDYFKYAGISYSEMDIKYPLTLKEFLSAVCVKLGYTLMTGEFANSDTVLYDDRFIGTIKYTYRDVLDHIAGAAGGIIYLNGTDLYVKYPMDTGYVIDENNLKTLSISSKFGPLNSLVLTNKVKDTVHTEEDEESIEINGLSEAELINNVLLNTVPEDYAPKLFEKVCGIESYTFELESFGYAFFTPFDVITVRDLEGNDHKSIITSDTVTVTTGLNETLGCQIDNPKTVDYTKKNDVQTLIKDTTDNLQDAVYYETNNNTLKIGVDEVELIRIRFTSKIEATPLFNASLIMEIDSPGLLEFTYMLDNVAYHVHPKHSVLEGFCTLHLFLPLYQLEGAKAHELAVMLKSEDAIGNVGRNQIQATVNGQGLEVVNNDWDGTIVISEDFREYYFKANAGSISLDSFKEKVAIKNPEMANNEIADTVENVLISDSGIVLTNITERIMANETVVNYRLLDGEYNNYYVEHSDSYFALRTDYIYQGSEAAIDNGCMTVLEINDLDTFISVESVEVK